MRQPLMFDLFAGLGGATEGFLAENWDCIGVDNEIHRYGEARYPAQLWVQDILTVDGAQLRDAAFIWASPPCTEFSWMAMPWSRAKQVARALRGEDSFPDKYKGSRTIADLTALFDACFRIQREASAAAGHHIPMVVENVKGAQPWVGRANWSFGSFFLWGDVPALMPPTAKRSKMPGRSLDRNRSPGGIWGANHVDSDPNFHGHSRADDGSKNPGFRFDGSGRSSQSESVNRHTKNSGGSWFAIGSPGQKVTGQNPVAGVEKAMRDIAEAKEYGRKGYAARTGESTISRASSSKSAARKAASAMIAKIPLPLSRHIAQTYRPAVSC